MKKIGILTFHNANNYGAMLQAYALKQALSLNAQHDVDILNYHCPKLQQDYSLFSSLRLNPVSWCKCLLTLPQKAYTASRFAGFRRRFLRDTPPLFPHTIAAYAQKYDVLITGSDQVFHPRITRQDKNFFLAFNTPREKNFSFAASFGLELDNLSEPERLFIRENLAHLSRLSVREEQGAHIVRALTGRPARVDIDPTFLLSHAQWQARCERPSVRNYVLVYLMSQNPQLITFAQQLAKAQQCELVYISPRLTFKNRRRGIRYMTPTVPQWLGLFDNARYVVTNSFHGLSFAINFNKPFFVGSAAKKVATNSRLENLLALTGLNDRRYTQFSGTYDRPVDWPNVNRKLDQERQKAFAYLNEITK